MMVNVWDAGRWAKEEKVTLDFMTRYIMEQLSTVVSFDNKSVLELGAGTGRLSYLILKAGARKVTLVDSSKKAIQLATSLFSNENRHKYEIIESDILNFSPRESFDIVFSSGVIEHFKNEQRLEIIFKHWELTREHCLLVHPTNTLYAAVFNRFPLAVKLYGYQKSFSPAELDGYLSRLQCVKAAHHRRFHACYTVPVLHNNAILNRLLDKSWGKKYGGLTLSYLSKIQSRYSELGR